MILSLAACKDSGGKGGKDKGDGKDRVTPIVKSPEDDPAGYLAMAMENTGNDVLARYAGSPLLAIGKALDTRGTFNVSGKVDTDEISFDLKALSLWYDLEDKELLLSLDAIVQEVELQAGACLSEDFLGVSMPSFFGGDDYYGIEPRNLTDQLRNSPLLELAGGELNLDDPSFAQMDELLDALWDARLIDTEKMASEIEKISMDYIKGLKTEYSAETVTVNGEQTDGYVFTATVTGEDIKNMQGQIYDMLLEMPVWDTLVKIAQIGGEEFSLEDLRAMVEQSLAEMDMTGTDTLVTYTVADEKVVSTKSTSTQDGQDMTVTVNYYDGGCLTAAFESGGTTMTVKSAVTAEGGTYVHELNVSAQGETMTIKAQWDGKKLTADLSVPGKGAGRAVMDLTATGRGFTVRNIVLTDEDETIETPLTFEYTSGGSVTMPGNTKNILRMNEEELMDSFGPIFSLIGGIVSSGNDTYGW